MKKIVALVVAASAISGAAMADSGVFQFSGLLTPESKIDNMWKVKIASGMENINAVVKGNTTDISIPVNKPAPLLSIHTVGGNPMPGTTAKGVRLGIGFAPQISYGNHDIDPKSYQNSVTPITLELQDDKGKKIGKLTVHMFAYGESVYYWKHTTDRNYLVAHEGDVFYGGLSENGSYTDMTTDGIERVSKLDPSVLEQYDTSVPLMTSLAPDSFNHEWFDEEPDLLFNAIYCSGFEQGSSIDLKLDSPMSNDEVLSWRATLPVTVSYA
ncbi:F4 family fimbrial subunit [Citrobacter freundii]|uniref:F4 family fimbrial subunit n=1 Tax=Citrobacter freundii TaxID=546 RepID=UPI001EF11870|nr:hypothetical protein [Citrobacter freundii]